MQWCSFVAVVAAAAAAYATAVVIVLVVAVMITSSHCTIDNSFGVKCDNILRRGKEPWPEKATIREKET